MNFLSTTLFAVLLIISSLSFGQEENYDKQLLRPQYHFSPEKNWQGAPSGLIYYEGEYHLFFQANPDGNEANSNQWGHSVSTDLVHWKQLAPVLASNKTEEDACAIQSGSVVVDEHNILKKQNGSSPTLVAIYTGERCGQQLAYSTDKGRSWQKYENNPVIPFDPSDNASAPKVFWHNESNKWIMLLSRNLSDNNNSKGISFYTSDNLIDWEYESHIPGLVGYPDLCEFKVENRPDEKIWILFDGNGDYLMGNFDGKEFKPTSGKMKGDWGKNYFATQTWNNVPNSDGRIIQIAWLQDGTFTGMHFNGQMSFPSELSVRKFSAGYKLIRKPIAEIELVQGKHDSWTNKNLIPGINQNKMKSVSGDCLHMVCEFDLKTSDNFGFMVRHSNKKPGIEIMYNVKRGVLTVLGSSVPLLPIDNKLKLEILLDRSSLEIYANDGQAVVSNLFEADAKSKDVVLFTNGGELGIIQVDVYEMKSIWNQK